ncbi:MAG: phospho-sugar mutase [Bacteroidales bacterium]|nr:phospho-sugar mutase [Bacteroidales bacterium]
MKNSDLKVFVRERAGLWLNEKYDAETRDKVKDLLENNEQELIESFYRDLEFGTGGLRGIMGVGTNRVNNYTIGMATQGLSNYLKKEFKDIPQIKVAVAHDSRNNSRRFAEITASIFSANGFKVYLFDDLRPTPELSFAIRYFRCQAGVVITASHNPKEYNGYKAYWNDGGQIIAPHDKLIIREVQQIRSIDDVNFEAKKENIETIGHEFDDIYTDQITNLSLSHDIIKKQNGFRILYTPLHGSGVRLVPMVLEKFGFANVITVPEQNVIDGNFPTVHSPNPEDSSALSMAIEKAKETEAELILATDPDADRVGIVIRDHSGEYLILNGNQAAALLVHYLLNRWTETGRIKGNEFIVKTIVTTDLLSDMARKFRVSCYNVLTGFKYIADIIRQFEGKKTFIAGGEESYGYLAGDFVRDKDAVISCALIAEAAAYEKENGRTLFDKLLAIYKEYGFYKERLISLIRKGKTGTEEIQQMMLNFRKNPPASIGNSKVIEILDYLDSKSLDKARLLNNGISIPKSDVLQIFTKDGTKISVRPSGTEPKIKFYFAVKDSLRSIHDYSRTNDRLERKIDGILKELNLD